MNAQERAYREFIRGVQQAQREAQIQRVQAARRAAERQQMMDEMPRRKYAVIVAVDLHGGFAKENQIPWSYPQDLKWFKNRTKGQVCVMGRKTYEDIHERTRSKGTPTDEGVDRSLPVPTSILPGRRCFVVSSSSEELSDATVVKSIGEVENHLTDEDANKTIFIIGGDRLFSEGIALADTVYVTVVNGIYDCDKFFPTKYLMEHFSTAKVYKHDHSPDLRFTLWKRNLTEAV